MTDPAPPPDRRGPVVFLVLLVLAALLVVAWGVGRADEGIGVGTRPPAPGPDPLLPVPGIDPPSLPAGLTPSGSPTPPTTSPPSTPPAIPPLANPDQLPDGGTRIFGGDHVLVAYYGTAQTPALGVLGETGPDRMDRRLRRAAAPFSRPDTPVRRVYELIVTVADRHPGPDGSYSHDIPRAEVARYIRAAHRNHALLLLDLQPGRTPFPVVARRWRWALEDPWVGLALDPEWRMGRRQVPARTVGQVSAGEINRTARWLSGLTRSAGLPQKLFVIHQFRVGMVRDIAGVRHWPGLAMVQHVDGFGTRRQKLATYHAVARPRQFTMGLKLFYDEDVNRMSAADVRRIRPTVRFVSFQ